MKTWNELPIVIYTRALTLPHSTPQIAFQVRYFIHPQISTLPKCSITRLSQMIDIWLTSNVRETNLFWLAFILTSTMAPPPQGSCKTSSAQSLYPSTHPIPTSVLSPSILYATKRHVSPEVGTGAPRKLGNRYLIVLIRACLRRASDYAERAKQMPVCEGFQQSGNPSDSHETRSCANAE